MRSTWRRLCTVPIGYGTSWNKMGPVAVPPEPVEVWLAAVTASLPFKDQMLLMVPPQAARRAESVGVGGIERLPVAVRAKQHFSNVTVRSAMHGSDRHLRSASFARKEDQAGLEGAAAAQDALAIQRQSNALQRIKGSARDAPAVFEALPSNSFDCVTFGANSFATVHDDFPHYITEASRAMKRYGVFCVWGHRRPIVIAESGIAGDYKELQEFLDGYSNAAERSVDVGHEDLYFPFTNVERRWFTSQYDVFLGELVASIRSWECYQKAMAEEVANDAGVGRHRLQRVVDPLDAFEASVAGQLLSSRAQAPTRRSGGGAAGSSNSKLSGTSLHQGLIPKLRIAVEHFVITCDNRSINRRVDVPLGTPHTLPEGKK